MTIVASNSLTVSNVNDGTTTHIAYANSADGTDGFTTVYPNLNLLTDSKEFNNKNKQGSNLTTSITSQASTILVENNESYLKFVKTDGQSQDWFRALLKPDNTFTNAPNLNILPNTQYTFSFLAKGSGEHIVFAYSSWTSLPSSGALRIDLTNEWKLYAFTVTSATVIPDKNVQFFIRSGITGSEINLKKPKVEEGSVATPHMPSASEVTTADWPRYIGQYTDFTQADNTNPSNYIWSLMRGDDGKPGADGKDGLAGKDGKGIKATAITYQASTNGTTAPTGTWSTSVPSVAKGSFLWTRTIWTYTDNTTETGYAVAYMGTNGNNGTNGVAGKDGVGIKTTTITYAGSTSGTTAPSSGWTSTIPTVAAGSYLWTKTLWTYTDNTSETGYSVAKMGNTGPTGPSGVDGNPGKVVSDTEPTTRFKGLTWKYSGTTDLTASDGTVILSGTEYYWSGTNWILSEINVHNINGNNLKITDGEFISTTTNGLVTTSTEIKDNHISISKDDSASDILNSITLDPEQGLAMAYLNRSTGDNRGVGVNFQGLFTNDNAGNYAQLTPQGTKLSTDVPWTSLTPTGGFNGGSIQFSVQNGVAYFSVSALGVPAMTANNWYQCAQLPTGSSAIPSVNKVTTAFGNASVWGFYVSRSGGLFFQCKSNVSATGNLANALAAFPIG
ncbi:hypothetical protein [Lactococcus sp.]|uniref:hypothetical protein n=1 Tax=Lactococcus sp. TaxID=44273 RepID=UPI002FC815F1